jgi:hypothetical protein
MYSKNHAGYADSTVSKEPFAAFIPRMRYAWFYSASDYLSSHRKGRLWYDSETTPVYLFFYERLVVDFSYPREKMFRIIIEPFNNQAVILVLLLPKYAMECVSMDPQGSFAREKRIYEETRFHPHK